MNTAKYIVTNGCMIVFSAALKHSYFKDFNITSAGFVSFGIDENNNTSARCYGESTSLGIKSNPEKDTRLANFQILANY